VRTWYGQYLTWGTPGLDWNVSFCSRARDMASGIYLDEGSEGFSVTKNLVSHAGTDSFLLHIVANDTITNNIFYESGSSGGQISNIIGGVSINANIFYSQKPEVGVFNVGGNAPTSVANNLYFSSSVSETKALIANEVSVLPNSSPSVAADPLFVNAPATILT